VEKSACGLFWYILLAFSLRDWGKPQTPESEYLISHPWFEPGNLSNVTTTWVDLLPGTYVTKILRPQRCTWEFMFSSSGSWHCSVWWRGSMFCRTHLHLPTRQYVIRKVMLKPCYLIAGLWMGSVGLPEHKIKWNFCIVSMVHKKVKLSLCLIKHYTMKAYGGVDV
jgi:hypothetical protein